jgi:hypothetical protein
VIDSIAGAATSKSGAQVNKANANNGRQSDTKQNSDERQDDSSVSSTKNDGAPVKRQTVHRAAKTDHRSDDDGKKKDDQDQSFEETIDKLVTKDSSDKPVQVAATMALSPGWNANNAGRQIEGDTKAPASKSATTTPTDTKSVVLPGSLLKQQSVEALLGARQRLLLAQKVKEGNQDNAALDGPETVQATVNARQSHWLFDDAVNTAATRVAETLQDKGVPPASSTTLNAAQVLTASPNKGDGKPASDTLPSQPAQTAQAIPAGDAAQQQALDSRQPNGGNSRDQMLAGNSGQRKVADTPAASSSDRASFDIPDAPLAAQGATQQVRTGIVKALADMDLGSRTASTAQLTPDRLPVANQVLRTIDITLSPPDLGTVRLKLSLKSNALDIDAEASKASTAKLLDSDRKGLEQSLRDAGYDVKSMKIADASASNSANLNNSSNGNGSSFQDGSQARGNFSGRQDGNMGRRDGAMPDQSQQQHSRDDSRKGAPTSDVAGRRQSDAIYI